MSRFWRWVPQFILMLPIALFSVIGTRYLVHPVELAARGIDFHSGAGVTVARIGFGAFPLACALFLLGCVVSDRRVLTGLWFVATLDSVVLAARAFAMFADASVHDNLKLIYAEVYLLALTGLGFFLESGRRKRLRAEAE